jgi:hypothetical protein
MTIDPRLYEKYSGRSGDPYKRLGEVLARDAKVKQDREAMPKGTRGGITRGFFFMGPWWMNMLFFWMKDRARDKGE